MLKYNDSAKHIHCPVPCPAYDIYGMESWLEHMAREGYLLSSDGFFLGFADFEVSRPCEMKYRLQAARKPRSIFEYNAPDDDEAELSEVMGWEFVARRGEFHIYRSAAPDAPELNTDPQVQAEAYGYTPMIYSESRELYFKYDLTKLADYDIWYCEYSDTPAFYYQFSMWQYSKEGKVDGVEGNVDLDICFTNIAEYAR